MSLLFSTAGTDVVAVSPAASINTLANWTVLAWVRLGASLPSGNATICAKQANGGGGTAYRIFNIRTTGQLNANVLYSDGDANARSANSAGNILAVNTWHFVGCSLDSTAKVPQLWLGDLSTVIAEVSYASQQSRAGSVNNDSAYSQYIGNVTAFSVIFPGSIAFLGVWNRELTVGEMRQQQFHPHVTSGCVGFYHFGFAGTGTQPDWSGNANGGSVTGATVSDHVPLGPFFGFDRNVSFINPLKTVSGVARSSIKSVSGVTLANIKRIVGVQNA